MFEEGVYPLPERYIDRNGKLAFVDEQLPRELMDLPNWRKVLLSFIGKPYVELRKYVLDHSFKNLEQHTDS